ncbi:hypothetical protein ACLEJW_05455 [Pseudomonas sp. SMSB3]|uniref:hypothetical protein n=2 Tax=Pseudomonas TaxID=286 RepID=UPI003F84D4B4|nr:hypothetical protein [Pseudomonas orientalis]
MKIGCLGWGSLIWRPGQLRLGGDWSDEGPRVPVEFSRVSDGGELATAIYLGAEPVRVFWAALATHSLEHAYNELAHREGVPTHRTDGIGVLMVHDDDGYDSLNRWALSQGLDALIWTALPPRFMNLENRIPNAREALMYLESLDTITQEHARQYIENVPAQIGTAYRRMFAERLGW